MGAKKDKTLWWPIKFTLNTWLYNTKLKVWAQERGMDISTALRFIIHEFFKDKPY